MKTDLLAARPPTTTTTAQRARHRGALAGLALGAAALLAGCGLDVVADTAPSVPPDIDVAYPPAAQRLEEEGTVRVRLRYDATGAVTEARVAQSSGSPRLDAAALAAGQKMRLKPGTRNGVPVGGTALVPFTFRLADSPDEPVGTRVVPKR